MNIVFFGNTKYSIIDLAKIHEELGVATIVTLPPRPLGRKKIITPNPVHQFGLDNKIIVLTAEQLNDNVIQAIAGFEPDFFIVADYGLILPKELLEQPKYAPLNIHQSLLPKYRGPSPAPTTILNGDTISGVSVIKMSQHLDQGDILAQKEYMLKTDETTDSLLTTLNAIGSKLVVEIIKNYKMFKPKPQRQKEASYTKMFRKEDGYIDLNNPPLSEQLDRMIRAYYPWPGVWTLLRLSATEGQAKIIKLLPNQMIQVEGKKTMSHKEFFNGYPELKSKLFHVLDK